ncbi:MAG: dienelactone hydrolase family protein [Actinomycetota bacterium]|nr:dienelactone hydrolase family protein [Actinomycetota bacterium]
MTISTRYESITAHDGGTFEAWCAVPERGSGPGILLFQEIFGVNDNMRGLAERLADEGYVALVPDMFWRLQPRFESKDESGMGDGMALAQKFDPQLGGADINATHAHLLGMDECTGKIGATGFCFGGTLTFAAAATSKVDGKGIDAAVSYYGSGTASMLGMADQVTCPMMFHYGNNDPFIPDEDVVAVEEAFAGRDDVTVLRYDAGHAFSNWDAPSLHDPDAADLAWSRTLEFFATHLR